MLLAFLVLVLGSFLFVKMPLFMFLALAVSVGAVLFLLADACPIFLSGLMLLVVPFNYGYPVPGAVIKLSELVALAMLTILMMRMATGEPQVWKRLAWASPMLVIIGLWLLFAVFSSSLHPHAMNVRYDIFNVIGLVYTYVFFRRQHWPWVVRLFLLIVIVETVATLFIRFVLEYTGINFMDEGGRIVFIQYDLEDIKAFAGGRYRLSGTMGHKNNLAALYVLLWPLLGLELLRKWHVSWLAVLIPSALVLMLSDSMTGWGAMTLVVVLTLLHLRRFDYLAIMVLMILPAGVFAIFKFGHEIFFRVEQLFTHEGWSTISARFVIFDLTCGLIEKHPWLGIGRNNFAYYAQTYYPHAHNIFLQKTVEMGFAGGLLFAGVIVGILGRCWRTLAGVGGRYLMHTGHYYHSLGIWLACLAFLAMDMFDNNYSNFSLGALFMMMMGLLVNVIYDTSHEMDTSEGTAS